MTVIGSAWVEIRGITDRLDRDIRRSLSNTLKDVGREVGDSISEDISRGLDSVDTSGLVSQVEGAGREIAETIESEFKDRLGDDAFNVEPEMDNSALRRVRHQLENLKDDYEEIEATVVPDLNMIATRWVSSRLAFLSRTRFVRFVTTIDSRSFATVLAALSGARLIGQRLTSLWERFRDIDKMILGISQWATLLSYASGWITMFVGDVLSLIVSIGRIIGAVIPLPGILAGLTIGIASTVAVMRDFKDILPEVGQELGSIRRAMSENFWAIAEAPIRRLTDVLLPVLRTGLEATAIALGGWFRNLSDSLRRHLVDEIPGMFDNMNHSINISASYTEQYAKIIEILGRNGAEYLPRLATWFGNISTQFANFLARAERSGELKRWADQGIENLGYLGSAIWGLGRIFYEIGVIAEEAGGSTLKSFSGALNSVADVIGREPFRSQMIKVFRSANDMIAEIADVSGPAVTRFFNSFADVVSDTFRIMGTVIGNVMRDLAQALSMSGVQRGFLDMMTGLGDGLMGLARYFPPISAALGALLAIIGQMGSQFLPTLGRAFEALSHIILGLAPTVSVLISALAGVLDTLLSISPGVTVVGALLGVLAIRFAFIREQTSLMSVRFGLAGLAIQNFARNTRTALATARIDAQLTGVNTALVGLRVAASGVGAVMAGAAAGIRLVGTAIKTAFMSNPVGIILVALTTAIGHFATKSAEAKIRVDQLRSSLDAQTGAVTELTRETITLNAIEDGHIETAKSIGISSATWVDALMGRRDAIREVEQAMRDYEEANQISTPAGERIASASANAKLYELSSALDEVNADLSESQSEHEILAEVMDGAADSADDHADAQGDLGDEVQYTNALLGHQINNLKDIIQLHADASRDVLDHRANQRALEQAYDDAAEAVNEFLKENGASTDALNDNTQAGRDNAAALDEIADRTWDLVGSTSDYGEKVEIVARSREEFLELAQALGVSAEEATKLVDYIGLIPADVGVELELLDTHAVFALNEFQVMIDRTTGEVSIEGDTRGGEITLGELVGDIDESTGTVEINGQTALAETTLQEYIMEAAGSQVEITHEAFIANKNAVPEYIETIPDIDIPMFADPEEAISAIAGVRTHASVSPATIEVDSRTGMAMGGVNLILGAVRRAKPTFNLNANPTQANAVRTRLVSTVNNTKPRIQLGANPAQGNTQLAGLRSRVSSSVSRIMIGGRDSDARSALTGILANVRSRSANISIGARNNTGTTVSNIISSISNRVATITVRAREMFGFANGGIMPSVKAYANGGVENHRAQIARAGGPIRMWAEPETGGEAYIPLAMSKRLRSKKILEEVAKMFGYSVIPAIQAFNNGGFSSGQPISSRNTSPSATITRGRNEVVLAPESVDAVVEGMVRGLWPSARAATLLEDWEKMGNTRKRMRGVR